ncbi:MAG: heme-binding domain-containing protein [Actinomycetota bacterium]|nr:heme-binding domain-containing protein [Actinomycetota bacterium]
MARVLRRTVLGGLVLFALLQLVPYGWWHSNPPESSVLRIRDDRAASLFEAACADCHSNRTDWPIYSYVAPMSWLVRRDVEAGRRAFNISEYATTEHDADDAADEVEDGSMPPTQYKLAHPDARLSARERADLADALAALEDEAEKKPDDADDEADDRDGTNSGPG